jgi:hypothetical protein
MVGTECAGVTQDGKGVTAHLRPATRGRGEPVSASVTGADLSLDSGRRLSATQPIKGSAGGSLPFDVRCSHLVAADGANSPVRALVGF